MNRELIIDMWYGDQLSSIDKLDCFWSDCDCVYSGNFYISGKAVGDYTARSFQAIEDFWNRTHEK